MILRATDLEVNYGGVCALTGVSFVLASGDVLGIMGPNGAGKTTLVDAVTGRRRADRGKIEFRGRDVTGSSLEANGRRGLVRTFQEAQLPPELTALDYLQLGRGAGAREWVLPNLLPNGAARRADRVAAEAWLEGHGLGDRASRRCAELAAGEQKLLHLLRAMWRNPDGVLLLDEPTAGLGADQVVLVARLIREYVDRGNAVAVVSHDQEFVTAIAKRVLHLSFGKGQLFERSEFARFVKDAEAARSWRRERFRPPVTGGAEVLAAENLTVAGPTGRLVDGVSFALGEGDILGIVGPNGAGKSSLLKAVLNAPPGRTGTLRLRGRAIEHLPSYAVARAGVGVVLQSARVPARLTVEASLQLAWESGERHPSGDAALRRAVWHDVRGPDDLLARFPLLARRRGVASGLLSGGEKMLLAVGMGVARRPLALLLDEPSTGLQDLLLRELLGWLAVLAGRGLAAAVIEQDVEALATISTCGISLDRGRVTRRWTGPVASTNHP